MNLKKLKIALVAGACMAVSCTQEPQTFSRTEETLALLANLKASAEKGIMYGHHDDTVYGIGWEGDEGKSDIESVCGDYPAVISFDLGEIELGCTENLDKVSFEKIRQEAVKQYERGGMVSMSWHTRNPKTGGDAWDNSDSTVVKSVLPDGECHEMFLGWIDRVADFLNSIKTEDGIKVPVLFRPWHEHTGGWFWWGEQLCTPEEYKALWKMTIERLESNGVNNALYAYSTGIEPNDTTEYLAKYPGDELIDLIGFDAYQYDTESFSGWMDKMLAITDSVGKSHNKIVALTETGFEGIPDAEWWTGSLLPKLKQYQLAYVLTWRNAREKPGHFFAPYPGQESEQDFVKFHDDPHTLFASDVNLYSM